MEKPCAVGECEGRGIHRRSTEIGPVTACCFHNDITTGWFHNDWTGKPGKIHLILPADDTTTAFYVLMESGTPNNKPVKASLCGNIHNRWQAPGTARADYMLTAKERKEPYCKKCEQRMNAAIKKYNRNGEVEHEPVEAEG